MNETLQGLFTQIREASAATKATFAALLLGAVAIAGATVAWSNRPHFVVLHEGLTDSQFAAVGAALAQAGVTFKNSAPPAPITIYVDQSKKAEAQAAMFMSNALTAKNGGILTGSSVFMSAGEREQAKRKREWQEMEAILSVLEYVRSATVKTSEEPARRFGEKPIVSGSVALNLVPGYELTRVEARTVAMLVSKGLGVDEERLIITHQGGAAVFDGEDLADGGGDWSEQAEREEARLERKANALLEEIYGPDKARVSVRTEWDLTRQTTVAALSDPKGTTIYEETSETKTPQFGPQAVGGNAGSPGNLLDPASETITADGALDARTGSAPPQVQPQTASTKDKRAEYEPSKTVTQTVRSTPVLERMSISLFLDSSLSAEEERLVGAVKGVVGFVETRDRFESAITTFYSDAPEPVLDENGEPIPVEEEVAEPSAPDPMVELLLTRGVEIVSALAFVVLLFVSLKGAKHAGAAQAEEEASAAAAAGGPGGAGGLADEEIDPELLAIRQVEQLLETDPERVGKILSSWAREHGMARL
ncbi:MAG: flagellar M-ring protein FliF C-terminal domain-containing protein [Planctomycetota bacterium]